MTGRYDSDLEVGGKDAIDAAVAQATPPVAAGRLANLLRTRAALGLKPLAAPAVVLIPIGVALGPYGLGILSAERLAQLQVVLPVALAALGVFVGLALARSGRDDRRLLLIANVESATTILVVSAAASWLVWQWRLPLDVRPWIVGLVLGVSASASSAGHVDARDHLLAHRATRIADLDDVLPLVVGGLALAMVAHPPVAAMGYTLLTCLVGLLVAVAGWMLFEGARGHAERGVFVLGAVTLLGGAPAYLGLSPLLAGLVAGLFWTHTPGRADQIIQDDLRRLQHPLVVILLLASGAALEVGALALWLFVALVALRLAGKLAGGWLGSRFAPELAPADLGAWLIPPGLIGLAFAFSAAQVIGGGTGRAVLSAVVLGTLASEIMAILVVPSAERR